MSSIPGKATLLHSFLTSHLIPHLASNSTRPLILGINGIQGSGKTTLVSALAQRLASPSTPAANGSAAPQTPSHAPLRVVTMSLDDFYLPRVQQQALQQGRGKGNKLLRTRGQPGTHDVDLCVKVLSGLREGKAVKVPRYDKSAHNGEGDREPESAWEEVKAGEVDVVLFEGWCTGFRPLGTEELERRWERAKEELEKKPAPDGVEAVRREGRLGAQRLEDVQVVDENLRAYDEITDMFDCFVHIDAEDTKWVYEWRLEQEEGLRMRKGSGMTDEQVVVFVNGYYPSYELYTEQLRSGIFEGRKGRQLRLIIGRDRQPVRHVVV